MKQSMPYRQWLVNAVTLAVILTVVVVTLRDDGSFTDFPTGPQSYQIVASKGTLPEFIEVDIDKPDVHVGDIQKFETLVTSPAGLESVTVRIGTDSGVREISLQQRDTEIFDDELVETWVGEWKVADTHDARYFTEFMAKDYDDNENSVTLSWTDACGIPLSGSWSLSTYGNCGIFSTDGVENGNVTIDGGYTLTLSAPFAWNPGYSVNLVNGAIAVGLNGQLVGSYIYVTDADADGYMANSTQYHSSAAGRRRRSLMSSWTLDCYDNNANAKLGQTSYFTVQRGDGSFDYNCDSSQTKQWTQVNGAITTCFFDPGQCATVTSGSTGWTTSVAPACGNSGTYVTNSGPSCAPRYPDFEFCEMVIGSSETRTQACR